MLEPKATQARVPSVKMVAEPRALQADRNPMGSVPMVGSRPVARLSALLPGSVLPAVDNSVHRAETAAVAHRHVAAVVVARRNSVRRAAAVAHRVVAAAMVAQVGRVVVVVHSAAAAVVATRPIVRTTAAGSVVRITATGVRAPAPVAVGLGVAVGSAVVQTVVRHLVGSAVWQPKPCARRCVRVVPSICRR